MVDARTHILPLRIYVLVGATLLLLTALTLSAAHFDFGSWNITIALIIAAIKASLVALFFMHLKYDNKIYALVFLMSILFLTLFITFTMFDTLNRGDMNPLTEKPIKKYAAIYESNGRPIPKPKNFTDSTFLRKADSAYVVKVIKGGGKAVNLSAMMPPYGRTLTKEEIEKLAKYVMFLSKDSPN